MELYKIIVLGVVCAIVIVYLKSVNSELTTVATVCSGILLLLLTVGYVKDFIGLISKLEGLAESSISILKIVIKIVGIAYLVEFSTNLIDDFGLKSIADKVTFAGKILILITAFPIAENLIKTVLSLL